MAVSTYGRRTGPDARKRRLAVMVAACVALGACGDDSPSNGGPYIPAATPTPLTGALRLVSLSVPPGQTFAAEPLNTQGQQVQELWATVGITVNRDLRDTLLQVFLTTPQVRCLGAGRILSDLPAGAERVFTSASMSNSGTGPPAPCPLPYTTTGVEVLLLQLTGQEPNQLLRATFPATYHFEAP